MKIYEELVARGLIAQVTDEKEIRELGRSAISFGDMAPQQCFIFQNIFYNSSYHFLQCYEIQDLLKIENVYD